VQEQTQDRAPDYTLWIGQGWHPPRKNVYNRGHWGNKAKLRKATAQTLFYAAAKANATYATTKRRIRVTLYMAHGQRAGDPDGYVEAFLDAMQDAGLLHNDNHHWCEMQMPIIARDPENPGTRIDIWDIQ
jgi:Holliday junction resolvase RusA-like endonuclease